jgi:hypothetical protein
MSLTSRLLQTFAIGVTGVLGLCLSGCEQGESPKPEATVETESAERNWCALGEAKETDGVRRLALVVGVGQYKNERVPDLIGPPNDARRFFDLLTGANGYGFPRENVCLLLDEQATTAEFKHAFDKALVARARPQDVAVVFYAGHGSMRRDKNGDEPDEMDETLMLHDARSDGVRDLVDDEFHEMLKRLHAKTQNITVVLDSCNSGTATRGDAGTFVARFFEPADEDLTAPTAGAAASGDEGAGWVPEALPGVVVFTAATDGTPALETNGRGIFTDAVIHTGPGTQWARDCHRCRHSSARAGQRPTPDLCPGGPAGAAAGCREQLSDTLFSR